MFIVLGEERLEGIKIPGRDGLVKLRHSGIDLRGGRFGDSHRFGDEEVCRKALVVGDVEPRAVHLFFFLYRSNQQDRSVDPSRERFCV